MLQLAWICFTAVPLLMQSVGASKGSFFAPHRTVLQAPTVAHCGISDLGYQCFLQVCSSIAMHWSLGGPPPDPGCKYQNPAATNVAGALNASAETVHIALVTDQTGYVAMSLPNNIGKMYPADAIIALGGDIASGISVKPYYLYSFNPPDVDNSLQLQNTALVSDGTGLRACFSRSIHTVGMGGKQLSLTQAVGMNFAASAKPGLQQHLMDNAHLCDAMVSLVAAAVEGGQTIMAGHWDVPETAIPHRAVMLHGALMILAWLVLLPSGVLFARHRWLLPANPNASSSAPARWFVVHRALQFSGMAVFAFSYTLPFWAFGADHGPGESWASLQAHSFIGITVAVLAFSQLALAFLRPAPDAAKRRWWNLQHWWTGRVVVLLAIINILIGIQVFYIAWGEQRTPWYVVALLLVSILVIGVVVLELMKRRSAAWQPVPVTAVEMHQTPLNDRWKSMDEGMSLLVGTPHSS